jgi:hypothetical protein
VSHRLGDEPSLDRVRRLTHTAQPFLIQRSRIQQIRAAAPAKIETAYVAQEKSLRGFRQFLLDLIAEAA